MRAEESTIYILDDEPVVCGVVAGMLRSLDARIEEFVSPRSLLAAWEDAPPAGAACVVLDMVMPEAPGLEVLRQLRRIEHPPGVVVLTGHGIVRDAVAAIRLGASDFLEKPADGARLRLAVTAALAQADRERQIANRRRQAEERLRRLTPGERSVLDLLLAGMHNKQIAAALEVSVRTVENRRASLMDKLGARHLSDLIQFAAHAQLQFAIP